MSLFAQFKTDPEIEKTGIDLEYRIAANKAIIVRIARAGGGNTRYNKVLEFRTKPYRRQIQTETIEPAQLDSIMREVYADAVVLGWWTVEFDENGKEASRVPTVDDEGGSPMQFERANVVKLATALPDLFADWQTSANKVSLFRRQQLEDAAGN